MSLLLNSSFDNWNFGTSFSNAGAGVQLADNWYSTGGGVYVTDDFLNSLILGNSTAIGAGFYQDFTVPAGTSALNISYTVFNNATPADVRYEFIVSDGVDQTSSGLLEKTYGGPFSVTSTVQVLTPSSAVNLRLYVYKRSLTGSGTSLQFHDITADAVFFKDIEDTLSSSDNLFLKLNKFFRITLSDSVVGEENLIPPTGPTQSGKGLNDSVRVQDWLRKRLRRARNIWRD